jgi:hypothetical protein
MENFIQELLHYRSKHYKTTSVHLYSIRALLQYRESAMGGTLV